MRRQNDALTRAPWLALFALSPRSDLRPPLSPLDRFPLRLLLALALLGGCTPEIGDKCVLSTDCSTRGDRLCDTSQPGGYCTQFICTKNSCPNEAACVLFGSAVPGCGYDDRAGQYGSRVARAFCVAMCAGDGDCRPGYVCGDPKAAPWSGLIQDDDQNKRGCLVAPTDYDLDGGLDAALFSPKPAPVCGSVAPARARGRRRRRRRG
jgi:hypothetical protein